mmetsp:Transcript_7689/g.28326  ORF Transcript_7689/g.28326 Transcript_7689/m.28326 type:complete len:723 (+) Transcript_7689:1060-3228(+)
MASSFVGRQVHLETLFTIVMEFGGVEAIELVQEWREVAYCYLLRVGHVLSGRSTFIDTEMKVLCHTLHLDQLERATPVHVLERLEELLDATIPAGLCDVLQEEVSHPTEDLAKFAQPTHASTNEASAWNLEQLDVALVDELEREDMKQYIMDGYMRFGLLKDGETVYLTQSAYRKRIVNMSTTDMRKRLRSFVERAQSARDLRIAPDPKMNKTGGAKLDLTLSTLLNQANVARAANGQQDVGVAEFRKDWELFVEPTPHKDVFDAAFANFKRSKHIVKYKACDGNTVFVVLGLPVYFWVLFREVIGAGGFQRAVEESRWRSIFEGIVASLTPYGRSFLCSVDGNGALNAAFYRIREAYRGLHLVEFEQYFRSKYRAHVPIFFDKGMALSKKDPVTAYNPLSVLRKDDKLSPRAELAAQTEGPAQQWATEEDLRGDRVHVRMKVPQDSHTCARTRAFETVGGDAAKRTHAARWWQSATKLLIAQHRRNTSRSQDTMQKQNPANSLSSSRRAIKRPRSHAEGVLDVNDPLSGGIPAYLRFLSQGPNYETRFSLRTSPIHGMGIYALVSLPPGEIIMEYTGEYIRTSVADARERRYHERSARADEPQSTYFFRIDDHTILDGTRKGSPMRFVNHSCDPNCEARILHLGGSIAGAKKVVLVSLCPISPGEEICYGTSISSPPCRRDCQRRCCAVTVSSDYKFQETYVHTDKTPCRCGAAKCRGFLD